MTAVASSDLEDGGGCILLAAVKKVAIGDAGAEATKAEPKTSCK